MSLQLCDRAFGRVTGSFEGSRGLNPRRGAGSSVLLVRLYEPTRIAASGIGVVSSPRTAVGEADPRRCCAAEASVSPAGSSGRGSSANVPAHEFGIVSVNGRPAVVVGRQKRAGEIRNPRDGASGTRLPPWASSVVIVPGRWCSIGSGGPLFGQFPHFGPRTELGVDWKWDWAIVSGGWFVELGTCLTLAFQVRSRLPRSPSYLLGRNVGRFQ
jgi:hypothetical protein